MGNKTNDKYSTDYYKKQIVSSISQCDNVEILEYLERFNRLYIEKYSKKE